MENDKIIYLLKELISEIVKETIKETVNEVVNASLQQISIQESRKQENSLIYGIKGLASFLGVTQPTAQKWKNDGVFPFIQRGRTIIFKSDEVLAGMAKRNKLHKPRL